MKKLSVVLLILALALPCIFAAGSAESKASAPTEKTPVEIYNPGYQFPTEPITIQYWHMLGQRDGFSAWLDEQVKQYEAIHPNVTVEVRDVPIENFQTVFLAALEAHTLPDVFTNQMSIVHAWGLATPAPVWVEKIFDTEYTDAANACQKYAGTREEYKGKYLGWMIAELDCGMMLYYNKDMMAEAGITKVPETMAEFYDAIKKTTKYDASGHISQGGFGIRYAGGPGGVLDKWLPILFAYRDSTKGWAFNEDYSDVADWTSPEFVEAAKVLRDFVWDWKVAATDMPAPEEAFKLGLVSFVHREAFLAGSLINDAPEINFGIACLPVGKYAPGVKIPVQLSYVSPDAKYPDVAWDFNMFLNTAERDLELAELTGSFPRRKANEDSDYAKSIIFKDTFEKMYERPMIKDETLDPYGLYDHMGDIIGEALQKLITDKTADPLTELAKAKAIGHQAVMDAKIGK